MHRLLPAALAAALALPACRREAPPAPPPPDAGAPAPAADAGPAAPLKVDVPRPPPPPWQGDIVAADLKALDEYRGFSADGLVFAYARHSAGAGLTVFSFLSATTSTVEKTVPLDSPATRRAIVEELREDGYPRPGHEPKVPAILGAVVRDGLVYATFSGVPAARPWKPFAGTGGVSIESVAVVAVSRDGRRAAVRVVGKGGTEFGAAAEYHVAELFESQ